MLFPVLIAIIVGLFLYGIFRKDKINLPGPVPWPVVGNMLQVSPDRPHDTFDKWHKKFNRVFKMYQLGTPVVVVGSYEGLHQVLSEKGKSFAGRPITHRMCVWQESSLSEGEICFSPPDSTWKMLRMTLQKHIKQFDDGMKRFENLGSEICEDLLNDFASHNGQPFDPKEPIMNATMNHVTSFLLGTKMNRDDKLFRQLFEVEASVMELLAVVGPPALLDIFPWLRFFGNKTSRLLRDVVQKRNDMFPVMKARALEERKGEQEKSILEHFLALANDPMFVGGESRIKPVSVGLIFAGTGSTTSSLYAFLNIISHYRHVYTKLQMEVDEILGNRHPRIDDRESMPYIEATILELLRYTSILPFTVPHMAMRDTSIGDAFIPQGTQVLINQWSMMHDESYWPEPFEFKSERFLDDSGSLLPPDHMNRKRLKPFGAGPRSCPGEAFALKRLFLSIASVIQRFEVEQPKPKVSCDPRDYPLAIVFCPPDFKVKMTPRNNLL